MDLGCVMNGHRADNSSMEHWWKKYLDKSAAKEKQSAFFHQIGPVLETIPCFKDTQ